MVSLQVGGAPVKIRIDFADIRMCFLLDQNRGQG